MTKAYLEYMQRIASILNMDNLVSAEIRFHISEIPTIKIVRVLDHQEVEEILTLVQELEEE